MWRGTLTLNQNQQDEALGIHTETVVTRGLRVTTLADQALLHFDHHEYVFFFLWEKQSIC